MPKQTLSLPSDADSSGRSFGDQELKRLAEVIQSGVLNCTRGTMVKEFEKRFAEWLIGDDDREVKCRAVTSGTAAVHTAVAAIDPEPGDEIITTPITDMGAICPIIYQTAIPIFADVDPLTYNVTAATIEKKITARTKAVMVTHLFGLPCEMDAIVDLCKRHDLPLIEDCAQAYGATYDGKKVGLFGDIGCFSLQQGKHMSSGEGGMVVSSHPALFRRMVLFSDKAWGYGDPKPDHYFLAPNYRMTELVGAVALAQLEKLPAMLEQRLIMAALLAKKISGVPGVSAPRVSDRAHHVYWKFAIRIDDKLVGGGADAFGALLRQAGVFCAPRYVEKPAFECEVLRDKRTFGKSRFPFEGPHRNGAPPVVYSREDTPGTIEALDHVVVLPINERYTSDHINYIADVIARAARELAP